MDFNEFKERVRSASDITDIIGRYVSLKKAGAYYKGLCPFHNEKSPSFFVMPDDQYFYCYGCHKGGDVFTFLCDHDNLDFTEALEELARTAGIEVPEKFDRLRVDNAHVVVLQVQSGRTIRVAVVVVEAHIAGAHEAALVCDEVDILLGAVGNRHGTGDMVGADVAHAPVVAVGLVLHPAAFPVAVAERIGA